MWSSIHLPLANGIKVRDGGGSAKLIHFMHMVVHVQYYGNKVNAEKMLLLVPHSLWILALGKLMLFNFMCSASTWIPCSGKQGKNLVTTVHSKLFKKLTEKQLIFRWVERTLFRVSGADCCKYIFPWWYWESGSVSSHVWIKDVGFYSVSWKIVPLQIFLLFAFLSLWNVYLWVWWCSGFYSCDL